MFLSKLLSLLFSTVFAFAVSTTRIHPLRADPPIIRQLTEEQIALLSGNSDFDPFGEKPEDDTVLFDPFRDECREKGERGEYRLLCPGGRTNSRFNRDPICVSEEQLCDNENDCPGGEDENLVSCQFHNLKRQQGIAVERELAEIENLRTDLAELRQAIERKKARGVRHRPHGSKKHRRQHSTKFPPLY